MVKDEMLNLTDAFNNLAQAGRRCGEVLSTIMKEVFSVITLALPIYLAQNRRVKHLALHSKKARVRKKNLNRIRKEYEGK